MAHCLLATVCAMLMALYCTNAAQTCQPATQLVPTNPPSQGFGICLYDKTDHPLTNIVDGVGNMAWSIQNSQAYTLGGCYCRQDCKPSQIVCTNPPAFNAAVQRAYPQLGNFNLMNGIAQFVYLGENWSYYCYCPQYVNATDACNRNTLDPEPCSP